MAQTEFGNQNNGLVEVEVRINSETLDEFRKLNPDVKIRFTKIGAWTYPCAVYHLPEDDARRFETLQQTEAKREQREARCLRPDGKGGCVRCNEKHKCSECEWALSFKFDNFHPTSYDALQEIHDDEQANRDWTDEEELGFMEPSAGEDEHPSDGYTEIMKVLIDRLTAIRPKYGRIFKELLKGNHQPLNIAKALHVGKSQVYTDVPAVMEVAKQIYFELMDK